MAVTTTPKAGSLSRRLTGNAGRENNEYEIAIHENDGPRPAVMMEMQLDTHAENCHIFFRVLHFQQSVSHFT